jgi:hypothetical protein
MLFNVRPWIDRVGMDCFTRSHMLHEQKIMIRAKNRQRGSWSLLAIVKAVMADSVFKEVLKLF